MLARCDLFDELLRAGRNFSTYSLKPVVDIYEDKEKIVLEAELPGIDPKEVDVEIDGSVLILKGHVRKTGGEYSRTERISGAFSRSFVLPETVAADKVSAAYDKGILTVTIPKKPETVPRRIEISGL